jgi:hypothetical protein
MEPPRRAEELLDGPNHRHRQLRKLRRDQPKHLIAQSLAGNALEELEKSPAFIVEPIEHHVLDARAAQLHDGPCRRRGERRVNDDRQGGELPMQLDDRVGPRCTIDKRVDDDDIRDAGVNGGS